MIDHDVPVPESRTFGFTQIEEAIEYAGNFPSGVLVKPLVRDAGRLSRRPAKTPEEVREGIAGWRESVPGWTRFLIERRIAGTEHLFYVVGGRVISVVRSRDRRWEQEVARPVHGTGAVHPGLVELAQCTMAAQPYSAHGVVRIIGSQSAESADGAVVVSAEPHIMLRGPNPPEEWARFIAAEMLGHVARNASDSGNVRQLEDAGYGEAESLDARVRLTDLRHPQENAQAVGNWFAAHGIPWRLDTVGEADLRGRAHAPPDLLAGFSGLVCSGRLEGERPQVVKIEQEGTI